MVRRTVTLPEDLEGRIREAARAGESFSAAVARLTETGLARRSRLPYVGIAQGGSDDSARVEEIIGEILDKVERRERGDP